MPALCDACKERPYVTHYGDLALCDECLAAIQHEIEDNNDEERMP